MPSISLKSMAKHKENHKVNYSLKVYINGRVVKRCATHFYGSFLKSLALVNWQLRGQKYYLRVTYGRKRDSLGRRSIFYNDGEYDTKTDFMYALRAFREEI